MQLFGNAEKLFFKMTPEPGINVVDSGAPILDFDTLLHGIRGTAFISLYAERTAR
jgi:hypothetical protein